MIAGNYDKLFYVERMRWSGESSAEISVSSFYGHLQQASANLVINLANSITITHSIWCDVDTDVQLGDTLSYNGYKYGIKQIFRYDTGDNEHLELLVERSEEYGSV